MKVKGITTRDRLVTINISGARVVSVDLGAAAGKPETENTDRIRLGPGLVDIQVNGFAGVDFNHSAFKGDMLDSACRAMLRTGVTGFFPTLITNSFDRLHHAVREIRSACQKNSLVRDMVKGIHLEGPYINPEDGPRGAHPLMHVTEPEWTTVQRLQRLSGGLIRLITIAPELPGALDFIGRAVRAGLLVALGHCAPEVDLIDRAIAAGAVMSTHLGNAAHPVLPRHANYIQAQMARDHLMASIICDGHHLPDYFVQNLVRAKGKKNIILITDATGAAGVPQGRYTMGDLYIDSGPDGVLRLPGTPLLAGSTLTMDHAVVNCAQFAMIDQASALDMATANPHRLFPEIGGCIALGLPADLIRFKINKDRIEVFETYIAGRRIYSA